MKLNLPSTITNQKALFFYFWTLVNLGKSKSGTIFENCLDNLYTGGNYTDLVAKIANDTQIEGSVAIGVGQITEEFQANIQLPPKSNLN